MTIASQTSRISYTGDGVTTAFSVPFYFAANADIKVYLQNSSGVQTLQTLGSQYNLTGATVSSGGTCTFTTAPTATTGAVIAIYRDPPVTQTTSYNNNDPFPAKSHENALDKLTTLEQRTRDMIARTVQQPDSDATVDMHLPVASLRASKILGFDTNGLPVATTGPSYVGGTEIGVAFVSTRAIAAVTTFDAAVLYIQTGGYTTAGDGGGARYKKGTGGGSFTSGGGTSWVPVFADDIYNVKAFGAKGDATTDDTTAIQAAITAAAGKPVSLPAGTYVITSQLTYSTTAGTFTPALKLGGAGVGITFIDNRVASNACLVVQSTVANCFQRQGYIRDLTIMTTTSPAASSGIELKAVYQFRVENVHIIGLTNHGAYMTCLLGDSDAFNIVTWSNCRFENNGGAGLYCNFAAGVTQGSFLQVKDCLFSGNVLCGYYYIGLQGIMTGTGFATNIGPGLWCVYNGSSNAQFYAAGNTFENNGGAAAPQVRLDSMQGGIFLGTEIASTVITWPAQVGFSLAQASGSVQGTRIEGTRVRISATFNPYTLFKLYAAATLNVISNTFWQSYDATGQIRYNVDGAAYGNRVSDSFDSIQVGTGAGAFGVACVNGANNNLALPADGAAFGITGPSGAFSISGFTNAFDGRQLTLLNDSGQTLTITHEGASSTPAQRIWAPGAVDLTVANIKTVSLLYMGSHSRWVVTGHS